MIFSGVDFSALDSDWMTANDHVFVFSWMCEAPFSFTDTHTNTLLTCIKRLMNSLTHTHTHTHLTTQTLSRWWRANHSHRKWGQDARERERERDDDPDRGRRGL